MNKAADVARLKEGHRKMAERCMAIALMHTPPDVTIKYRKSLTGRAYFKERVLAAPRPVTRKSLYIYLHECAHFHLHANSRKPRHVEEYEAEQWAHQKMREAGIAVPRSMTKRAKEYVVRKIDQALKRGAKKIDKKAAAFAGRKRSCDLPPFKECPSLSDERASKQRSED